MKYLHTMVRVRDLDASLDFYCRKLGLVDQLRRHEVPAGRFTLVFLAAPGDESAQIELTWNWDIATGGLEVIVTIRYVSCCGGKGTCRRTTHASLITASISSFLRRVGGGYIFIHRYLLEYFASLEPEK